MVYVFFGVRCCRRCYRGYYALSIFFANYEDLFRATNWTFIVNYHFLDKVSLYKATKDAIPYQCFCNTFYIWIESILDGPFSFGEIKQYHRGITYENNSGIFVFWDRDFHYDVDMYLCAFT